MIVLLPAYNRVYETLDQAEHDWNEGLDFKILKGPYCSVRDSELLQQMGHDIVLKAGKNMELSKIIHKQPSDKFEDAFMKVFGG